LAISGHLQDYDASQEAIVEIVISSRQAFQGRYEFCGEWPDLPRWLNFSGMEVPFENIF
jgi:hypothetical protein